MSGRPHAQWGRPLAAYILAHGKDKAMERVPYDAEFEPIALDGIQKVCRLAGDIDTITKRDVDQVTLSTLNTILKLSQSPLYLRHFESTLLISGCIKLMTSVSISGKSSPFSYEYGYLSFKILTIAIGACVLARSYELTPVVERMIGDRETPILQMFSNEVSQVIKQEIEDAYDDDAACDWLLGWAKAPERPQEPPLASRVDISTLLNILAGDCKAFMKAWSSTFSPRLSGVMFLLWRYVFNKCIMKSSPQPEIQLNPFCELIWRCMIMATTDEVNPLMYMFNTVQAAGADNWEKYSNTPAGRFDADDSRTILNLFIMRMAPVNLERYSRLGFAEMTAFLRFIKRRVEPGCENLFPQVFNMVLDRTWEALNTNELDDGMLIDAAGRTLMYLGNCMQILGGSFPLNSTVIMQITAILAEKRVFELVGRVVLMMKYTVVPPGGSDPEAGRNGMFRVFSELFFEQVEQLAAESDLERAFSHYVPEWLKISRHLATLRFRIETEPRPIWDHYEVRGISWWDMAKCLGLEQQIKAALESGKSCSYARCPAPNDLGGGQLTCRLCYRPTYCSAQCQARDWVNDFGLGSHQTSCTRAT
ncbi:MYND finger protein [Rhizoctonia solani AG-3 Rhs1AP]|uniref:MYND finger protein n=2 Tax=Rhizoctonia solani AG-3 TaxID=1086053 RepID=A0A074SMK7_9AGAM|nr:MYND finger protein [Rhizoctonia solani AG-3 Rhs1AP]KEP51252.1 MYND finger protein [Rhizoctonia solani 123E]